MKTVNFLLTLTLAMIGSMYFCHAAEINLWAAPVIVAAGSMATFGMQGALFMALGPNVDTIAQTIGKFGGDVIRRMVNDFSLGEDFQMYRNVTTPILLPKISALGNPRPYRATDDFTEGVEFTDRTLTAYQSKWDLQLDPENYRNTYLAGAGKQFDPKNMQFWQFCVEQVISEYLSSLNDLWVLNGSRNVGGTGTQDIADGLKSIILAAISDSSIPAAQVVATGNVTSSNALAKVEEMAQACPAWMKARGFKAICSYNVFQMYAQNYASEFGFQFTPDATGQYRINNFNGFITPRSWMLASYGIILVPNSMKPLSFGTDLDSIAVHPTPHLNTIKLRLMMPVGLQISDPEVVVVNDSWDDVVS